MTTLHPLWTSYIPPPMPLIRLPGTIQLARSPFYATSIAPIIAISTSPARVIPIAYTPSTRQAPTCLSMVVVCLLELTRSGSTSSRVGKSPIPSRPLPDINTTSLPGSMYMVVNVGMPIPRLSSMPSCTYSAARRAIRCLVSS